MTIRLPRLLLALAVALALVPATTPAAAQATSTSTLEVHFLDVGQGDATLLVHDDTAVLIDTGRWQTDDVVGYLDTYGIERLDLVAVTHPHADHIGQFDKVAEAVDLEEVWWSSATATSATYRRAVTARDQSGATYREPRGGQSYTIGELTFDIIGPDHDANFADLHDSGLSFSVSFAGVSMLFTGDAEAATEQRYTSRYAAEVDSNVLQLGHHGSSTSTTPAFFAAVDPDLAVYSAGAGNSYGHPHASVVNLIVNAGVPLYGTDVNGTVTVTTDGATRLDVSPERGQARTIMLDDVSTPDPTPAPDPTRVDACPSNIPNAGFVDVQQHTAAINCLAWWDITQGVGDGTRYHPAGTVTRAQMASFIARSIIASGGSLPTGQAPFNDVSGPHANAIGQLAAAGVVSGYSDGTYRPAEPVTRAQMATFLTRAFEHRTATKLDSAPAAALRDVTGNPHEAGIRHAVDNGWAAGYSDRTYRPGLDVRRDHMALFITRWLGTLTTDHGVTAFR